jgi:hypothetical protein
MLRLPAKSLDIQTVNSIENAPSRQAANVFALARNRSLSNADIDAFIDPSVKGSDRQLARALMAAMPANSRGDFIAVERNNHLVSNNPSILRFASVSTSFRASNKIRLQAEHKRFGRSETSALSRNGIRPTFFTSCGPPSSNTGAYVRDVSACGMTDGWGFVNVTCGSSHLAYGDQGNMYMEITGSGGSVNGTLSEGGLQFNSDTSIQGYVRTSYPANQGTGYQTMNYSNPGYHYGCGQNLTITHGISGAASNWIYTMVGQLPSNIDPEEQYVNMDSEFFYPDNYVWLWTPPGADMNGPSFAFDPAGYKTPCLQCSVAKVDSIAQPNGYVEDGSTFGDINGSQNGIHWLEVIFGEYASSCTGQAGGTCQIESSADPAVYYAGTENYPNAVVAQDNSYGTSWGPYEGYDGLFVGGGGIQQQRASGPFTEPLPPMPCSPDADGQCVVQSSYVSSGACDTGIKGPHGSDIFTYGSIARDIVYRKSSPVKFLESATETVTVPSRAPCTLTIRWSPGEPRVQYNDPNLP